MTRAKKTAPPASTRGRQDVSFSDNPTDRTGNKFTLSGGSPCVNTGATIGDEFDDCLNPTSDYSSWWTTVGTLDQDAYTPWEIGAYVHVPGASKLPIFQYLYEQ